MAVLKLKCKVGDLIRIGNLSKTHPVSPDTYREGVVTEIVDDLIFYDVTRRVILGVEQPPGNVSRGTQSQKWYTSFWKDTPMDEVFQIIKAAE